MGDFSSFAPIYTVRFQRHRHAARVLEREVSVPPLDVQSNK
jgi:hypothetical protein